MNFRVGEKVVRTNGSFGSLAEGAEYTVDESSYDGIVHIVGHHGTYRAENFDLVKEEKPALTPHTHQKEIIAWANGATIQVKSNMTANWSDSRPKWDPCNRYRVKPDADKVAEIKEEIAKLDSKLGNLNKEATNLIKELDELKAKL
tara:strand:+ start:1102 stop:1539 length:438 start_codon:yes stop_codon:yes gene_type:complete